MTKFLAFIGCAALLAGAGCGEDNGQLPTPKPDSGTPTPDAGSDASDAATLPMTLPADAVLVPGDDPNIQYMGRFDTGQYPSDVIGTPKEPWAALGGSSMTIKFTGTAVGAVLEDQFLYSRRDYFDAIVDDKMVGVIAPVDGGNKIYPIAVGLTPGDHVVTVVKRTESGAGRAGFKGFMISGQAVPPPPRPTRKLWFIGDSITAGEGVDATSPSDPLCNVENAQIVVDVYKAFGPTLARQVGAEYHLMGIGGMGLMRNYSNTYEPRHMPDVFDLVFGNLGVVSMPSPVWDPTHALWVPDAIVIALGTNDFAPGDSMSNPPLEPLPTADTFAAAYEAFVTTLRGYFPNAEIFGVSSPGQPTSATGIMAMVKFFSDAGDAKVHAVTLTNFMGTGCTTHPNAMQHVAMAKEIGDVLKPILNW